MSSSNGSFAAPIAPDLTKEAASNLVRIAAGAGVAAAVVPPTPQSAFTVYNVSANWVRLALTFAAGTVTTGAAATRVALVPPGGTYSADAADEGMTDAVAGAVSLFASMTVLPVDVPVAAGVVESGTLVAAAAAQAGYVAINWMTC